MTDFATSEASATAPSFVAYTAVPAAEQLLEQHLGANAAVKLPPNLQEGFVKFFPWITLIFLPFHIAAVLLLFGFTALAMFFGSFGWVSAIFSAAILVCDVIALPGLFKRTQKGWTFFVYAQAIAALSNLVSFSIFGLLVSVALFWVAFQVKYKYT
jgi:hypothetical protein